MKILGRRSFLRVLAAVPFAGRAAADATAKELSGLNSHLGSGIPAAGDLAGAVFGSSAGQSACTNTFGGGGESRYWSAEARRGAIKIILEDRTNHAEITSTLYRCHRRIHSIDPDIGSKRSWSLAAKITFQRQRMVEIELAGAVVDASPWQDMREWVDQKIRHFLIG